MMEVRPSITAATSGPSVESHECGMWSGPPRSQVGNRTEPGPALQSESRSGVLGLLNSSLMNWWGLWWGRRSSDGDFYQLCVCVRVHVHVSLSKPSHSFVPLLSCCLEVLTGAASPQHYSQFKGKVYQKNETSPIWGQLRECFLIHIAILVFYRRKEFRSSWPKAPPPAPK